MRIIILMKFIGIFFVLSPVIANAQEWEYLTIGYIDALYEESLKIAGENGWELVSSRRVMIGKEESRMAATEAIFKRQKKTHSKFKTIEQTKNTIEEIHTRYIKEIIAEEMAEIEKLEEANRKYKERFAKIARLDSIKIVREAAHIEALTIKKVASFHYIQTNFIDAYSKFPFYYVKFAFKNISNSKIDKIMATCFVMDGTRMVRKKERSILKFDKILSPNNSTMYEYTLFKEKDKFRGLKFHVIIEKILLVDLNE